MSKNVLNNICTSAQKDSYSWALYFFKIDKRAKQPFKTNKVRFKNDIYLLQYARNLLNATKTYQVDQISEVQDYDGENSKVSCDKLLLTNELVSEQWKLFTQAVATSSDQKIKENDMELKLKRKPQKHRAIVIDSLLNSIEYEIKEEGKAEDILELIIDIRNTADRIIKLLKGE